MYNTLHTWCARVLLALISLGLAASAQASTLYTFNFTDTNPLGDGTVATGSFITDGASPDDPGYELITYLMFDYATALDYTILSGPLVAINLPAGAAYNPMTGAFVNHGHWPGDDLGFFDVPNADESIYVMIGPGTFAQHGVFLANLNSELLRYGATLFVDPGIAIASTVPEPASLLLLGTGLLGAVIGRRRTRTT